MHYVIVKHKLIEYEEARKNPHCIVPYCGLICEL